ncbi:phage-related baseplate assembly protein [Paraburkholderia sp. CI2]|uniref:baseplate assembly protein n=1 Tax=Paraburkholderia sp. CI2 TaxID=2723093 RepID=UPI00161D15F0|nr:baseplate J/gp47 family protein [Paraburkholderia sp. CI2]MBB5469167.1 phage-related baseplate assembly protein [Paraburkholderia sp. CI2]
MSTAPIDLSRLPAPDVVEQIDFEAALAERKAGVIALMPEDRQAEVAAALELESEPIAIVLQESVYREIYLIQKINDAARSVLLAFAEGTTLEHLAAFFDVERLEIEPADPETGAAAVMEKDGDLRYRTQLAPQGFSVAGPELAYQSHARNAHGDVLDASATSPEPGDVLVTILSRRGDGTPDQGVIDAVNAALSDDDVRPITDHVKVQAAEVVRYSVVARIRPFSGPDSSVVLQEALDRLADYRERSHRIGREVTLSGIYAALHVEGVERVTLIEPAADVTVTKTQAPWCDPADVDVAMESPDDE